MAERARHILYLGRIHPKKNIAGLIDAWSRLCAAGQCPSDAKLIIAGWGKAAELARRV